MNWDDGTGGGVSFERQAPAQVPLTYGSRSGDRWAPGIETPGSQSTGEASRAPMGASGQVASLLTTSPGKGTAKAAALFEGVS